MQASAVKADKSTYESVDAQQDEVDGDDHRSLDVDYSSRDWVVVDEQVGKKSLLVRRIPKRIPRYRHIATVNIRPVL